MIYLFVLILFLIPIIGEIKRKEFIPKYYYFLCLVLVLLSGLQYRMGADIVGYMGEYSRFDIDFSWNYISSRPLRQPLWVLLNVFCKSITDDFVLLKFIQAIFINVIFFWFIKKESTMPFTAALLYFLTLYFQLNFNELRQSFSIAFFFLAYGFLERKKYLPYYLLVFIAYEFHEAAIILFALPFLNSFKVNKRNIMIFGGGLFAIAFLAIVFQEQIMTMIANIIFQFSDLIAVAGRYFANSYYSNHIMNTNALIEYVFMLGLYTMILVINISRNCYKSNYDAIIYLLFVTLFILNGIFPILYRLSSFFMIFYVFSLVNILDEMRLKRIRIRLNGIVLTAFLLIFFFVHNKFLFREAEYGEKPIIQFYPYTSIIDKQEVPEREACFKEKEFTGVQ